MPTLESSLLSETSLETYSDTLRDAFQGNSKSSQYVTVVGHRKRTNSLSVGTHVVVVFQSIESSQVLFRCTQDTES